MMLIIANLIIFMPNTSYGICNTFNFSKEVSAVQLILANGHILNDIRVSKNVTSQTQLFEDNYKSLNLVFLIETDDSIYQNRTNIISFINKLYDFYGQYANKIHIGIIPFSENFNASNHYQAGNIYKNSKEEVINEVYNLQKNNGLSLEQALKITVEEGTLKENIGGVNNEELLQQIILITNGIENEETLVGSNVILKILNENMIAMYGIIIGNWYQSNKFSILSNEIDELLISNIESERDISSQLENDVYNYISNYVIDDTGFMPTGGDKNTMLMSNRIVLIADSEIAQGAVLKIEYKMPIRPKAFYGTGNIRSLRIVDKKAPELAFSREEKLITDPSKTNADYGWDMVNGELVTTKPMAEANLVLSVLLSAKQLEEAVYTNSATCYISFDVGSGSTANYTRSKTAMEVQVLPPFKMKEENYHLIIGGMIGVVVVGLFIIVVIVKIRKKNKL